MPSPFSNSTEWEIWSSRWCEECQVDEPAREREDFENGCPLILTAYMGETPVEWVKQDTDAVHDRYHCANFVPNEEN